MLMDLRYLVHRKYPLRFDGSQPWDIFVSAYNDSERVRATFSKVRARRKVWVALPEYGYSAEELRDLGEVFAYTTRSEADVVIDLVPKLLADAGAGARICVDITGFMRPHILFLVHYLRRSGLTRVDMLYTEPERYERREETKFSNEVVEVRQVAGFDGTHSDDTSNDILIIGVGYDDLLMSRVLAEKEAAKQVQLLSLPSLSADMYQESILRLDKTSLAGGDEAYAEERLFYAPANDPFVVAHELGAMVMKLRARAPITNLYLSPLATKPQALGFALFYLNELEQGPSSIIFPFSKSYSRETSDGVGKSWVYELTWAQ